MKIFSALVLMFAFILPLSASGGVAETYVLADTGLTTKVAVDIVEHNGGIWFASSKGLMITYDEGQTWVRYDEANGLISENISAIFSDAGGRLWIGSSHPELISDVLYSLSDGLTYTDDDGDTWEQIDFGSGGLNIPAVWGGDRTIYDITGHTEADLGRDWLFFTAFAGGLLASQDGGVNWRRIFPSAADSVQFFTTGEAPSLRNRTFACEADSAHGDTTMMWVGSASGVFQYIWVRPPDKLSSTRLSKIVFCDDCTDDDSIGLFIAGNAGLSRSKKLGGGFTTRTTVNGLPGDYCTDVFYHAGRVLVGSISGTGVPGSSALSYSDDLGATFTEVSVAGLTDSITDFAVQNDFVYMAAGEAGLFVSADTGFTWEHILVDSADPGSAFNTVNAVNVLADTVQLGTDTGFVRLYMAPSGVIDSVYRFVFEENSERSRRIIDVNSQTFSADEVTVDSVAIWTVNRPMTLSGEPMVARSVDGGQTWLNLQIQAVTHEVDFIGDTVYVVGEDGIRYGVVTTLQPNPIEILTVSSGSLSLDQDTILSIAVTDSRMAFGTSRHLAVSRETDSSRSFVIYRANIDTLTPDVVINYTFENSLIIDTTAVRVGLTGDFIPAIAMQYLDGKRPRIWASGRPVTGGGNGMAVGNYNEEGSGSDTTINFRWRGMNFEHFAWNYAFNGDTVFAATDAGVLWKDMSAADSLEATWDTLSFITNDSVRLHPGTPVYGVLVTDGKLWVGSDDGTVVVDIADFSNQELFLPGGEESADEEVYAFPTPFSPDRGGELDFHFTVDSDASVTIEIYDFAMNLVARPIDNVFYPAGTYHGGGASGGVQGPTWDGRNGKGDLVAVGMYYFKVDYSTGESRWGKLAVIP